MWGLGVFFIVKIETCVITNIASGFPRLTVDLRKIVAILTFSGGNYNLWWRNSAAPTGRKRRHSTSWKCQIELLDVHLSERSHFHGSSLVRRIVVLQRNLSFYFLRLKSSGNNIFACNICLRHALSAIVIFRDLSCLSSFFHLISP